MIQKFILRIIKFYKLFISPNFAQNCRFYPSCSSFAIQAIEEYGVFRGLKKGFWRVLRCNPLSKGGVDLP